MPSTMSSRSSRACREKGKPRSTVLAQRDVAGPAGAAQTGLAERVGWGVKDLTLLKRALAHRSWCAENPGQEPNERLEFLGDAVLGLITTDYLYREYPTLPEGELAKARAAVVNSASLASIAREVGLGDAVLLGKGEDASGGRSKASILADTMEAVIGAIYLDAGYEVAERVVMSLLEARLRQAAKGPGEDDYKTRLQELCARHYDEPPSYLVTEQGPDHAKVFEAEVLVAGLPRGRGRGRSKKQAEQMAARHAWSALMSEAPADVAGEPADGGPKGPTSGSPTSAR